jgi:hypothetical protein
MMQQETGIKVEICTLTSVVWYVTIRFLSGSHERLLISSGSPMKSAALASALNPQKDPCFVNQVQQK